MYSPMASPNLLPCGPGTTIDQLVLQRPEETLRRSIVPTVGSPTHAAHDAPGIECFTVASTRVLNASIRVMDQPVDARPVTERPLKRIET